jgi:uncharacterized protein YjbJ (UPF0337 family)
MKRSIADQAKDGLSTVSGTLEEAFGRATGNDDLKERGKARQAEVQARREREAMKEKVITAIENTRGVIQETAGVALETVGELLDDEKIEKAGKVQEARGKSRQTDK